MCKLPYQKDCSTRKGQGHKCGMPPEKWDHKREKMKDSGQAYIT